MTEENKSIKVTIYQNRYRDRYWFEPVDGKPKHFKVCGKLEYWRYGGQEGEPTVDMSNLGFADPSGGPFMDKGFKFDGGVAKRIYVEGQDLFIEVE